MSYFFGMGGRSFAVCAEVAREKLLDERRVGLSYSCSTTPIPPRSPR